MTDYTFGWRAALALEAVDAKCSHELRGAWRAAAQAEGLAYGLLFRALELAYDKGLADARRVAK
jgi:hypothetical protein